MEDFTGYRAEVSYISLIVGNEEIVSNNIISFICSPNPASGTTMLTVKLDGESLVDINLFNSAGKKVQSVFKGNLKRGDNSFTIQTNELSAGIYIATLVVENETTTLKIIITN